MTHYSAEDIIGAVIYIALCGFLGGLFGLLLIFLGLSLLKYGWIASIAIGTFGLGAIGGFLAWRIDQ